MNSIMMMPKKNEYLVDEVKKELNKKIVKTTTKSGDYSNYKSPNNNKPIITHKEAKPVLVQNLRNVPKN